LSPDVNIGPKSRAQFERMLSMLPVVREGQQDLRGIVRCFLPAPANQPGIYDFVLGYNQSTVQPFVRVIRGFTSVTTAAR
jgi:hypothetical protein